MSIQVSHRSYEPNKLHKLQPPIAIYRMLLKYNTRISMGKLNGNKIWVISDYYRVIFFLIFHKSRLYTGGMYSQSLRLWLPQRTFFDLLSVRTIAVTVWHDAVCCALQ